jgi:hypothetical protein
MHVRRHRPISGTAAPFKRNDKLDEGNVVRLKPFPRRVTAGL